ncbi:MAG: hypothetical protein U5N55_13040 [Cypionkella sp.]|nr:hypothetical protein [Cypionkella sp.]
MFEATGGLEAPLRRALAEAGVTAYRVNPARARAFARSTGAGWPRRTVSMPLFCADGARLDPSICAPEPEDWCEIRQLRVRRRQLVQDRSARGAAGQAEGAYARAWIARVLALLDAEITAVEAEIAAKIKASPWGARGLSAA